MFKRVIWFGSGAAMGAAGSVWARRRIEAKLRRLTPGGVRDRAVAKARRVASDAQTLVGETRAIAAARRRERVDP